MEDEVKQLAGVAALGGNGIRPGAILVRLHLRETPLSQHLLCGGLQLVEGAFRGRGRMKRHLLQVARGTRGLGTPRLVVLPRARNDAADKRNGQQQVDGLEPHGFEDIEKLELVVDLRDLAVGGDVLVDVRLVERALWQQGARNGGGGQQEKQGQCRAHTGEPVPRLAQIFHEVSLHRRDC